MKQQIILAALVVEDYDDAIEFYTKKLDFELLEDTDLGSEKRWVRVAPPGGEFALLLARGVAPEQLSRVGNQTGGRVFLFLQTDDFWRDYRTMIGRGVTIIREPSEESYGTVAVFADLYGNQWDLVEMKA